MTFPAKCFRLHEKDFFFEAIKTVNWCITQDKPVYRWRGPQTSYAGGGDLFFSSDIDVLASAEFIELPESAIDNLDPLKPGRVAMLWDKSFLWGYLAVSTLRELGFSFDLLTAEAVRKDALKGYQLVIVPGGWASLKSEALGASGRDRLRRFVRSGGGYLGLCGGAGLALQVDEGLSLLPVARKPMVERLPNFSGSIRIRRKTAHPLWWGLEEEVSFQVWWPSQFDLMMPEKIQVLGTYGNPERDFCVSDLNVCDTLAAEHDWEQLERAYGINLDPERLLNEPAVVEGKCGEGRVLLSYPHLETPGDVSGNLALFNIWYDLLATSVGRDRGDPDMKSFSRVIQVSDDNLALAQRMAQEAEELVALGESYRLWSWRNPWLLQWKRGIRGSEFGTISVLLQGLAKELALRGGIVIDSTALSQQKIEGYFEELAELWDVFKSKSHALIEEEEQGLRRNEAEAGIELSPQARALRKEIFNCVQCYGSKSYSGLYRQLLDKIDTLLLGTLQANAS